MPRNKPHRYDFLKTKNPDILALLASRITDLDTLRERFVGSTMVAFDTEGVTQHFEGRQIGSTDVSELGVAVFRPGAGLPRFYPQVLQFYEQNDVEAFTIRMRERPHGPAVGTMTEEPDESAGARLHKYISEIPGERILLGWDMRIEMRWISEKCPSIAELFTSWCDVQELVGESYRVTKSNTEELPHRYQWPALMKTMQAFTDKQMEKPR
jgi:hypothetical protein